MLPSIEYTCEYYTSAFELELSIFTNHFICVSYEISLYKC